MDVTARPRLVLADTTPLYAAFTPSDQYHDRAQSDLHRLEQERLPVGILTTTILEAHTLVLFRHGASSAHVWFDAIASMTTPIHPTMDDFKQATRHISRFPDQRLTFFDALMYVVSERLTIPIWSYDHHFDVLRATRWY
jgi:predicted nucleic acid-binding protein